MNDEFFELLDRHDEEAWEAFWSSARSNGVLRRGLQSLVAALGERATPEQERVWRSLGIVE